MIGARQHGVANKMTPAQPSDPGNEFAVQVRKRLVTKEDWNACLKISCLSFHVIRWTKMEKGEDRLRVSCLTLTEDSIRPSNKRLTDAIAGELE